MSAILLRFLEGWWQTLLVLGAYVGAFAVLERLYLAERGQRWQHLFFNLHYGIWSQGLNLALTPWLTVAVVAWVHGVWPSLLSPASAVALPLKIGFALTYLFCYDLGYYAFHRLQHRWPLLWREHLLHHSDTALNATTALRHHWLEEPLKVFFIALPLAVLFDAPPLMLGVGALVVSSWPVLIHANLRIGFGPGHWLLSSPQTHRIHHSRLAGHADRNFAVFFPIIDRVFGTWYEPGRNEYPPTGLHSGRLINSQFEALLSPFLPDPPAAPASDRATPAPGAQSIDTPAPH